jgi:NADH-quinone oxidoreductase subunit N
MTAADVIALSPLIVLTLAVVLLLLVIAIQRNHRAAAACTLAGLAASFVSLRFASTAAPRQVTALLVVDDYSLFYSGFLIVAAAAVVLLAFSYIENRNEHKEEFYLLILLATLGTVVLASSRHFVSLFLGIEILSVSLYALAGYLRAEPLRLEAGVKYLILAATSSAFLLFGMALLYSETGSMDLVALSRVLMESAPGTQAGVELAGVALLATGIGFKLAAVPFHLWTPDVYEGAPLPVTAFIASVSKGGVFALLLRWFHSVSMHAGSPAWWAFATMAVASMLAGNLLALQQNNVKRLLAYSSIGHMGYLLVAFLAAGPFAVQAATYYLIAYATTIVAAFGVLTLLSANEEECCQLEHLKGLYWTRPVLAGAFAAILLSLAGIPLTAGFLGKFYVVSAAVSSALWIPIFVLVVSSTIGIYYYLRVLVALFSAAGEMSTPEKFQTPRGAMFSLAALVILIFILGVYPAPLWNLIQGISPTT